MYKVIDDFYSNFDLIERSALSAEYIDHNFNFDSKISILSYFSDEFISTLSGHLGKPLSVTNNCGRFRFYTEGKVMKHGAGVHCDKFDLACVVYISNHPCFSGTILYRNKRYGSAYLDPERCTPKSINYDEEYVNHINESITSNLIDHYWEECAAIEGRKNRCVLIDKWVFHKGANGLGCNVDNARITHNFFVTYGHMDATE